MSMGAVGVYEYISAYAKGTEAYERFLASLVPTHDLELIAEHSRSLRTGVSRQRYRRGFLHHLTRFDGNDVWGLILNTRPQKGERDDAAAIRYLQAAGSASAMVIEIRQPAAAESGTVSVRSVVGHRHDGPVERDVAIELPRAAEMVCRHEVFDAEEATAMFETYYRTGELPDGYTLRAVDGYPTDGTAIPLDA
jgi:hypothetical protein